MTTSPYRVFGALFQTSDGGFVGDITIDACTYRVRASAEKRTSPKGAVFQMVSFVSGAEAPFATAALFVNELFMDVVDKPGIQLICNYGPRREPIRLVGFFKVDKTTGERAKTPFYCVRNSRPRPEGVEAPTGLA